jgi:ribosomal protein L21E
MNHLPAGRVSGLDGFHFENRMLPDIPWFVYAMLLAPVGLIVFAAIYKSFEVRAASDWPSVPGEVVISAPQVRKVKVIDGNREEGHYYEERNFANVTYQYVIAGQTYRNNRVTIGEDRGNFEVAETIARYPVGKPVTVYYNPNKRSEAVLERDLPKGLWGCIGWMVAIAVVLVFGSAIGFNKVTEFASTRAANAPLTVALGAFGAVMALVALAIQRHARQARHWPTVKGTIATSGLERFRSAPEDNRRGRIMFKAKISYTYSFNGMDYTGTVASISGEVSSTSDGAVQRWVKRYRDGQTVDVYVNPANPSESVLEPRARGIWVVWVIVAVLWAMAVFVATRP